MFASSVTTIGRPHGLAPSVQFIDTRTLCFAVENGVLLEDIIDGQQVWVLVVRDVVWLEEFPGSQESMRLQRHVWLSKQQGAEVSVGRPLIAADPPNRQMALHQPGSSHVHILSLDSLVVVDKLSTRVPELPGRDTVVTWLHLSFSSDGLRLAAIAQAHCSVLCIYRRQDPVSPFELLCTAQLQSKGTPIAPKFFPGDNNFISFAGAF